MNWDAVSFDWNHLRAFLAVVEEGSLSGAARVLGQTQPTLSRQVSNLEAALEVTLFTRGARDTVLTDAGMALLDHVRQIGDAATQISRVARGRNQTIQGTVRISSTDAMAAYVLHPYLKQLQGAHPGIDIELVSSNELSDLTRREADIAIRHVRPEQPDLIAQLVGEVGVSLFASGPYLDKIGRPKTPAEFADAAFIGFEHPDRLVQQVRALGFPVERPNFKVTASSGVVLYELARQGVGIALLPTVIARDLLGLEQILPEIEESLLPIWLVTHRDVQTNLKIRLSYDLLAKTLRSYRNT